jgi:AcrR family transcriptional regulator
MGKVTQRLTREDWILAGFRALTAGGAGALMVEPVARSIGATKGSFYWHFADPADWRAAMLAYWEDVAFQRIINSLSAFPPGRERLQALVKIATTGARDPQHGGVTAEPALRDWARYSPEVATVVARVDAGRIAFVEDCFAAMGVSTVGGRLFYAAYLGLGQLQGSAAEDEHALLSLTTALAPGG